MTGGGFSANAASTRPAKLAGSMPKRRATAENSGGMGIRSERRGMCSREHKASRGANKKRANRVRPCSLRIVGLGSASRSKKASPIITPL